MYDEYEYYRILKFLNYKTIFVPRDFIIGRVIRYFYLLVFPESSSFDYIIYSISVLRVISICNLTKMVLLIASPLFPLVCPSIFRWRLSPGRFISRGEDRICLGRPVPKNPLSLCLSLWTRLTARREREDPGPRRASSKAYSRPLEKGRGGEGGGASVDRWRRWKEGRGSGRSIARPSPLCPNNVTNNLIRLSQTPL